MSHYLIKKVAPVVILICGKVKSVFAKFQKWNFKEYGINVFIGHNCEFTHSHIHIGNNVYIGSRASFIASIAHIYIGNYVMFGPNVTIRGGNHRIDVIGDYMYNIKTKLQENDKDVIIEDDVWVGCNSTILKGVTIGKGSVVAAGAIVIKDVPPYTIVGGNPAKVIRPRFSEKQIIEHEAILLKR